MELLCWRLGVLRADKEGTKFGSKNTISLQVWRDVDGLFKDRERKTATSWRQIQ